VAAARAEGEATETRRHEAPRARRAARSAATRRQAGGHESVSHRRTWLV